MREFFLLLFVCSECICIRLQTTTSSALYTEYIAGVEGYPALLPCDVTPPHPDELVALVLWYRGDEGEPLYSYDSRQGAWNKGQRWSDEKQFGARAHLHLSTSPAELRIEDIQTADTGIYRCRVDFKSAPTRNSLVNLTVIVPPRVPHVFDGTGRELVDTAGPYLLGTVTSLKCVVDGGSPKPGVTWWREGSLVDSSWEEGSTGEIYNILQIGPLNREDLGTILTCQGSNNNQSVPSSRQISLDMVFPPTKLAITTARQPLSAGQQYTLDCESQGSRPHAVITWWMGERFLGKTEQSDRGEVSKSQLIINPKPEQDGQLITCRAENTNMRSGEGVLEDTWNLAVYYPPIVRLKLGHKLDSHILEEGSDIYFECDIKSNPQYYKILWYHNTKVLDQNIEDGIILSGQSLVLQRVGRERKGNYSCLVSNIEGDVKSNVFHLSIKYSPRCNHTNKISVGTTLGTSLKVRCVVDSFPPAHSFSWTFNNSKESINVKGQDFEFRNGSSILTYSAVSDRDFGQLYCWAANERGQMKDPCIFSIIPAGPPQPPSSCSILNQTTDLLQVECIAGFDGGLDQTFLLELIDSKLDKVLVNVSSGIPHFTISGLNPGRDLELRIYGVNQNGRSRPTVLDGFRLKVAELQIDADTPVPVEFTPFLGILAGILVTLFLAAIIIILIIRRKYRVKAPSIGAVPTSADAEEYYPTQEPAAKICYSSKPNSYTPDTYYPAPQLQYLTHSSLQEPHGPDIIPSKKDIYKLSQDSNSSVYAGTCRNNQDAAHFSHLNQMRERSTWQSADYNMSSPNSEVNTVGLKRPNITVNPSENPTSWTPLLHLHQESIL